MIKYNLQFFGGRGSAGGNAVPAGTSGISTKTKGALSKLTEPERLMHSSKTTLDLGERYGTVTLRITRTGKSTFRANVDTPQGGTYQSGVMKSFEAAKNEIPSLVERHIYNRDRFKNRKLSEDDLRLLMNGL